MVTFAIPITDLLPGVETAAASYGRSVSSRWESCAISGWAAATYSRRDRRALSCRWIVCTTGGRACVFCEDSNRGGGEISIFETDGWARLAWSMIRSSMFEVPETSNRHPSWLSCQSRNYHAAIGARSFWRWPTFTVRSGQIVLFLHELRDHCSIVGPQRAQRTVWPLPSARLLETRPSQLAVQTVLKGRSS